MRPDGRFAPSPTGELHLGNLRTALLAWLYARAQGARFLLRVEDLDRGRVAPEHEAGQLADLAALGLDWDGPVAAPVRARRGATPRRSSACAPTTCSTPAGARGPRSARRPPRRTAPCPRAPTPARACTLTAAQRAEREAAGRPPALRVRAGAARVAFRDRLHGPQEAVVDDFVVRRNDGAFAYNLAVVVDDGAQGVGEVVRGDDLLDSTPRQLWLAERLGLPAPSHAHVPLVLGADGAPAGQAPRRR